jgi:hypothetical protein
MRKLPAVIIMPKFLRMRRRIAISKRSFKLKVYAKKTGSGALERSMFFHIMPTRICGLLRMQEKITMWFLKFLECISISRTRIHRTTSKNSKMLSNKESMLTL